MKAFKRISNKTILAIVVALSLLAGGCSALLPGKVEVFQREVKAVPAKSENDKETERQAADYLQTQLDIAYIEAVKSNETNSLVLNPLKDTRTVAPALSSSLGKPLSKWTGTSTNLARKLDKNSANLDSKLEKYRNRVAKDVGKDIEGTGLIQLPYLIFIGIIFFILVVGWTILKIVALSNPGLSAGIKVVEVGGKATAKIASELVEAGEEFKNRVRKKVADPKTQELVLELFRGAHLEKQSRGTQDVIKKLTN